jgi:hypothetical protein
MTLPLDVMTAIIGHFGGFGNVGFGKVKHLQKPLQWPSGQNHCVNGRFRKGLAGLQAASRHAAEAARDSLNRILCSVTPRRPTSNLQFFRNAG